MLINNNTHTLKRQYLSLRAHLYHCNRLNGSLIPAIKAINNAHTFLTEELTNTSVASILEEHKNELDLFENGHYFELIGHIPEIMDDIECICAKTYTNNGICVISIYFEGSFYSIISDINEDEPLLDVDFPDVSQEGNGIILVAYDENSGDDMNIQWRKLSLWQSLSYTTSSPTPNISNELCLPSELYTQTYCILKPDKLNRSDRDVFFRFGSWCYSGNVDLIDTLSVEDIPHVIPALRIQQHKLAFLCDVTNLPEDNIFSEPMIHNYNIIEELEPELLAVENEINQLVERADSMCCHDDPSSFFFEFRSNVEDHLFTANRIDLIATKSYRPNGLIVMSIYFKGIYYLSFNDGDCDIPMLDSHFPSIIEGKGYELKSYECGLDTLPNLKMLMLWLNADAMKKNDIEDKGMHLDEEKLEKVDECAEYKIVVDANNMNKNNKENKIPHRKQEIINEEEGAITIKSGVSKRKNLGAFHHLAPLRKPSALAEHIASSSSSSSSSKEVSINKGVDVGRKVFDKYGRPFLND